MPDFLEEEDLKEALNSRIPYSLISTSLQFRYSVSEYHDRVVKYSILCNHAYHRLPEYVRVNLSESAYYVQMIQYARRTLQIYAYTHQRRILLYTKETPLTYYRQMLTDLLKKELNYDQLPNFTALDIFRLLSIGRNQFLNLTKEVRSKAGWQTCRDYIPRHLPTALIASVQVHPFWKVLVVNQPVDVVRKACQLHLVEDYALYRLLLDKNALCQVSVEALEAMEIERSLFLSDVIFACELPQSPLLRLYRKGFVSFDFDVFPEDRIVVPPLQDFVMNRTCDDPQELLLYRVLFTADERTPLHLLAQLLMVDIEDLCATAHLLVRLGLAELRRRGGASDILQHLKSIHRTWRTEVEGVIQSLALCKSARQAVAAYEDSPIVTSNHPLKRIALFYDVTLAGFFMTNLTRDSSFRQHVLTLFEVGKLPDESVGSFLSLLHRVDFTKEQVVLGNELLRYVHSAFCLRETLKVLRSIRGPQGAMGVDLLKIEPLNALEASSRYSILGRNYWSYIVLAPLNNVPLLDIELPYLYGNTVSLMPSPWLFLFFYSKMHRGPPAVLIPFGSSLHGWPAFFDQPHHAPARSPERSISSSSSTTPGLAEVMVGCVTKLRVQSIALDSQVSYLDLGAALSHVNILAEASPVFVQCAVSVPLVRKQDGSVLEMTSYRFIEIDLPFTANAKEVAELATKEMETNEKSTNACESDTGASPQVLFVDSTQVLYAALRDCVNAFQLGRSLGYITCCVGYYTSSVSDVAADAVRRDGQGVETEPQEKDGEVEEKAEVPHEATSWLICTLDTVQVVGIGFGIPLTSLHCSSMMLSSLPGLLSEASNDVHTASMQSCAKQFSLFLDKYSSLKRAVYKKLAMQSIPTSKPEARMHLQKFFTHAGALPFPRSFVLFDGVNLRVAYDAHSLSQLQ